MHPIVQKIMFFVPFSGSVKMDNLNIIQASFALLTLITFFTGALMNICENHLPDFIKAAIRYGKFAYTGEKSSIPTIEVPKSWFRHFYSYSAILTVFTLTWMILRVEVPEWFLQWMDLVGGKDQHKKVSYTHSLLGMLLLTIQCCRRFYDTHYVSIFAENCKMNISLYFIGFCHYTGATAAILAEMNIRNLPTATVNFDLVSNVQWMAALLFLWACYQQYSATVILANLRKNKNGEVISKGHKIPYGGLFEYLSNPHFTTEMLMYIFISIVLWGNTTWIFVCLWVISNQTVTCLLSHWWYVEKFPEYPKNRKALIPFIY